MGLLKKRGFKEEREKGGGGGGSSFESKRETKKKKKIQKSVARSGVCEAGAGAIVLQHFLLKNLIVSCCAFSQGDSLFA